MKDARQMYSNEMANPVLTKAGAMLVRVLIVIRIVNLCTAQNQAHGIQFFSVLDHFN